MRSLNFVYGAFRNEDQFLLAFGAMKAAGLKDLKVVRNTAESITYSSAIINNPVHKWFRVGGAAGAVIGGLAGALASPLIPASNVFQVLTTMMAGVSGAVMCAYFGGWVVGFLYGVDPWLQSEVFEGTIENGSLILGVEVDSQASKMAAIQALTTNGAIELIVRDASLPAVLKGYEMADAFTFETPETTDSSLEATTPHKGLQAVPSGTTQRVA